MALLTAAQVREHYPQLVGTGQDPLLDTLIARADSLMAAYCGYPLTDSGIYTLEDSTYTEYLSADPSTPGIVRLTVTPVQSITSTYADETWGWDATTLVPSTDRAYESRSGIVWLLGTSTTRTSWTEGYRSVKVVYVGGWATPPAGLIAIGAMAVRDLVDRGFGGELLSASTSRQTVSRGQAGHVLSEAVRGALDAYVLWGRRAG
jgi:hypothetical protein